MSAEKNSQAILTSPIRLLALHAQAHPAVKELNQLVTILGAGDGADLILGSSRVDAAHTAIVSLPGGTYVRDLGAPGGTLVGGHRIRWSRLADGDHLTIGPFSFRVQLEDDWYGENPDIPVFQLRNDQTIGTVVSRAAAIVIGSDSSCDIVLKDSTISPRHALVAWTREGTIVRDLTGRSSVRHNGRPVRSSGIANGDAIGIGTYEMIYETQTAAVTAATTAAPTVPASAAEAMTSSRGISLTPWLDESPADFEPAASDEALEIDTESSFEGYADDEGCDFTEKVKAPEIIESRFEEGQEMSEEMLAQRSSSRTSSVEQCSPELKARVAAAQCALDERARKLREELKAERALLKAYQDKLQEQARQLLMVARQKQEASNTSLYERFEELEETSQSYADAESHHDSYDEAPAIRVFAVAGDDGASLQQRVHELVNMVQGEKEEMYLAENRLESLRFDIDRLCGTVLLAKDNLQARENECEARYAALKRSQSTIHHERESLTTRLRRLDSKETELSARVQEAERIRTDLETESELLNRAQEQHDERLRVFRISLEGERHRLRVRQAELQRKAADLAKLARTRRKAIEQIVTQQQSEPKEPELKAKRSVVAEAGRAELERAATELEHLLSIRLAEVETEILKRQENLDNRLKTVLDAAKPITDTPATTTAAPTISDKFEPISSRWPTAGAKSEGEKGQMAILEKELEGMHRAVRKLEEDSKRCGVLGDANDSQTRNRLTSAVGGRGDLAFTSKFSEKIAAIRRNLIKIRPREAEGVSAPGTASPDQYVGANR